MALVEGQAWLWGEGGDGQLGVPAGRLEGGMFNTPILIHEKSIFSNTMSLLEV